MSAALRSAARVRLGHVAVDVLTFVEAVDAIAALVAAKAGGIVFTPNVDHVVMAERDPEFRAAYQRVSLSLADGAPVVWASRFIGPRLPAKVSGSDLVLPLAKRAGQEGWRLYLLGGGPGVATDVARRLATEYGAVIAGVDDAVIQLDAPATDHGVLARIQAARPDLVFIALGSPKQEIWMDRAQAALGGAVAIGVGASFDFVAGRVRRAPSWVSDVGLEWAWRLMREPRRLWRRYLLRDPAFVGIVWRTWRGTRHAGRALPAAPAPVSRYSA